MKYAGDVSASDAYSMLSANRTSVLIDVRTEHELRSIGEPDLADIDNRAVVIPWIDIEGNHNLEFAENLVASVPDRTARLLVPCRSGARSRDAAQAATEAGYPLAFNIADGFEGPPDEQGDRGTIAGWQAAGLPWKRSG